MTCALLEKIFYIGLIVESKKPILFHRGTFLATDVSNLITVLWRIIIVQSDFKRI